MSTQVTFAEVIEYVSLVTARYRWDALQNVLGKFTGTDTIDWALPPVVCSAFEVPENQGVPASAALLCAQAAIILVDDILDADPKGMYREVGVGRAANLAMALESIAFRCLTGADISHENLAQSSTALAEMFTVTALGQSLDVNHISDEEQYWTVVRHKSSPFYGLALQLGGLMAECAIEYSDKLFGLGCIVGEIVQLYDDLFDALETPARPDWRRQTNNLLILYASTVEHDDKAKFLSNLDKASDPAILKELHQILLNSEAVSYCVYNLTTRHKKCRELLEDLNLPNKKPLLSLLDQQLQPVEAMLEKAGLRL